MDYSVLERSALFKGVHVKALREALESVPHHIQCYDKEETVFYMMDAAERIGIVLEGHVQAQKVFPSGSQINVTVPVKDSSCPGAEKNHFLNPILYCVVTNLFQHDRFDA